MGELDCSASRKWGHVSHQPSSFSWVMSYWEMHWNGPLLRRHWQIHNLFFFNHCGLYLTVEKAFQVKNYKPWCSETELSFSCYVESGHWGDSPSYCSGKWSECERDSESWMFPSQIFAHWIHGLFGSLLFAEGGRWEWSFWETLQWRRGMKAFGEWEQETWMGLLFNSSPTLSLTGFLIFVHLSILTSKDPSHRVLKIEKIIHI